MSSTLSGLSFKGSTLTGGYYNFTLVVTQLYRFMRVLFDLTVQLYEILLRVDRRVAVMRNMDSVCDLLYHIKYQFTGDSVKQDAERVVRQLKPALQLRLRFIAQVGSYKFKVVVGSYCSIN